jgi:hypothetical protein
MKIVLLCISFVAGVLAYAEAKHIFEIRRSYKDITPSELQCAVKIWMLSLKSAPAQWYYSLYIFSQVSPFQYLA